MADLDLRVDYQDDILDSSVNTKRKYNIIDNADGTKSLEDVSEYAQRGDSFGAADINKTNQAVLDLNQSLNDYVKVIDVLYEYTPPSNNNYVAISIPLTDYKINGYEIKGIVYCSSNRTGTGVLSTSIVNDNLYVDVFSFNVQTTTSAKLQFGLLYVKTT